MSELARPRIGVSACLLGQPVRFDGGHKSNRYIREVLRHFVELVPVCPEVEAGLGTPRETLRLVRRSAETKLLGNKSGSDYTAHMQKFATERAAQLAALNLDGMILKKDSPSCGVTRVRIYPEAANQPPSRDGQGLFAAAVAAAAPSLPLAEEGWLCDAALRQAFLDRSFTHWRLRTTLFPSPSAGKLVAFHSQHKLMYMAHNPRGYRALGQWVGQLAERPLAETLRTYTQLAMQTLADPCSRPKQVNVLQHILGYFKRQLSSGEKQELLSLIEEFRGGLHEVAVPLALLLHHLHKYQTAGWLSEQRYFDPYPKALAVFS